MGAKVSAPNALLVDAVLLLINIQKCLAIQFAILLSVIKLKLKNYAEATAEGYIAC